MNSAFRPLVIALCLGPLLSLNAGVTDAELKAASQAMAVAAARCGSIAESVAGGSVTPAAALDTLRRPEVLAGFSSDEKLGLALAAIDVGQRLVARRKTVEAMPFFQEAEQSLADLVGETADTKAAAKAGFLQKLAMIRGRYLGKAKQAKADMDAAIALQPDDEDLRIFRDRLGNDQAESFRAKPKV